MLNPAIPAGFPPDRSDLGATVQYFPVRKIHKTGNLLLSILFLLGALASLAYGLFTAYTAYMQHGAMVLGGKLIPSLIITASLLVLVLVAGWGAYSNWHRGAVLYEKGFAVRSRKGIRNWRWEDIAAIKMNITRQYTNGIYTGTTHEYTLLNQQNERLTIDDALVKVDELAEAIQQNVFARLYEPAAQQYNQGKPLAFGPLVISKLGLQFGKKTIPWEEVKEVSLKRGNLKVSRKQSRGASVPVHAIPNLNVLLAILQQVVGLKTS